MTARTLIAFLLTLSLVPAVAHGSARQERGAEDLTPEEEREARDLARQFVERLREDNDVEPLVKDFFVRDFSARLRHDRDQLPMFFVAPEVAARASEEELLCFYIAEFNFFSRTLAYFTAHPSDDADEDDECDDVCEMERAYPPEVFRVLRDDPVFSGMLEMERAQDATVKEGAQTASNAAADTESKSQPEEVDETFIKDVAMLRAATATTLKAAEALRAYTPEFSALRHPQEADTPEEAHPEVYEPRLEIHEKEYLGFPPGTRFIEVNVEPARDIQIALILFKEDGRLRVLLAIPILGD